MGKNKMIKLLDILKGVKESFEEFADNPKRWRCMLTNRLLMLKIKRGISFWGITWHHSKVN
jgi:hypothetical protein